MNNYVGLTEEESNRELLITKIKWLCTVKIIDAIPADKKKRDLKKILKNERSKYLDDKFVLKQIDFIINFNNLEEVY